MEPAVDPLKWEILRRKDSNNTIENLYKITVAVEIIDKLGQLVDGIDLKGTRSEEQWTDAVKKVDVKHKAEMLPILDKIKLLCTLRPDNTAGPEWKSPNPEQHVLRKELPEVDEKRILHVRGTEQDWRFNCFPEVPIGHELEKSSTNLDDANTILREQFKTFIDHDARRNFYFLLPDLLGLFFSKLGIAPPLATAQNFYIPIVALYARWVGVLLGGESTNLSEDDIAKFEPDPAFEPKDGTTPKIAVLANKNKSEQPNMYQITWMEPTVASGLPAVFSLGASIGGFHGQLGKRNFGGLFRKARWDICDRDKELANMVANWKWPTSKQKIIKTMEWKWAKDGGSLTTHRYGNCGETYTFLHMLSHRTPEENRGTKGIALSPRSTTLDPTFDKSPKWPGVKIEYSYDHITQRRQQSDKDKSPPSREFFVPLCPNCEFVAKLYGADLKHFKPTEHLPIPVTPKSLE